MSGKLRVTTETGSVYVLDGEARTATRVFAGPDSGPLRRDNETVTYRNAVVVRLGAPLVLLLNLVPGFSTVRTSSPVVSIEHDSA